MRKKKTKILIVEDEAIVAEHLAVILERNGYTISGRATSGKKAIQMAKRNRPDLMLVDIRIEGDLNGIETAIVIQGHFEEPIPVVFLTAFPAKQFPVLAVLEPYTYLNKPIRDEDLLSAVARVLAKKA
jgi:CheY-like chemotaxis protein